MQTENIKAKTIGRLIENLGTHKEDFYNNLEETPESFWVKFVNGMDFTATQMSIIVEMLHITEPSKFFYEQCGY